MDDAGIVNNAGLDGSKRTGGILFECLSPTKDQATQFSDIVIEDNSFINNSFGAVTIKQWNGSGNQYGEDPGWANRNGSGGAPDYADENWKPHSNIIIQDNYINQGASAYACNGIYLTSSRDSLIQRNVLENIGTCGLNCTLQTTWRFSTMKCLMLSRNAAAPMTMPLTRTGEPQTR